MSTAARLSSVAALALALAACFQPTTSADELAPGERPPSDLFADATPIDSLCGDDPTASAALHVSVRTSAFGGRFMPRNVGAIWIEDAAGAFVKTVEVWGETRLRYLTKWQVAGDGNDVDAVTGATLLSHTTHAPTWNLTGLDGCEVDAGDYVVAFEHTDRNGTGASLRVPITIGDAPSTTTPDDTDHFHELVLTLE